VDAPLLKKIFRLIRRLVLLSVVIVLMLLGVSPFYIYDRFNQETPIARLQFQKTGDYAFIAELSHGDFCTSRYYDLLGDQFQLDAGFVKWNGLGVLLGLSPRYRLDRLSGRYSDVRLQNSEDTLAHDLAPDVLFDFFQENNPEGDSGWLMDTSYGSSIYLTIDPTLSYTVFATEDGLITRSAARQDFNRENGQLVIEVNRGCGANPALLENLSERVNTLAISLLD
jgi:hypothetical protein